MAALDEIDLLRSRIECRRDMYKADIQPGHILAIGRNGYYLHHEDEISFVSSNKIDCQIIMSQPLKIVIAASIDNMLYTVDLNGTVRANSRVVGTIPNFIEDVQKKNRWNAGYRIICDQYNVSVVGDEFGYTMHAFNDMYKFAVNPGDIYVYILSDLCVFNTQTHTFECNRGVYPCDVPKDAVHAMFPGIGYLDLESDILEKIAIKVYIVSPTAITTIHILDDSTKAMAIHSIECVADIAQSRINKDALIVLTETGCVGEFTANTAVRPLAVIPGTYFHPMMNNASGSILKCDEDGIKMHAFLPPQIFHVDYKSEIALPYRLFVDATEENYSTMDVGESCHKLQDQPEQDVRAGGKNPDNPDTVCDELHQFSSISIGDVGGKSTDQ